MKLLGFKYESSSAAWTVGRLVRRALRVCGGSRRASHRAAVVRSPLVSSPKRRAPATSDTAPPGALGKQSKANRHQLVPDPPPASGRLGHIDSWTAEVILLGRIATPAAQSPLNRSAERGAA
jgi:hypothetical protein